MYKNLFIREMCGMRSEHISCIFCGYTNKMTLVISINDQILYDLFKVLAYYFHYIAYIQHTFVCLSCIFYLKYMQHIQQQQVCRGCYFPYMYKI